MDSNEVERMVMQMEMRLTEKIFAETQKVKLIAFDAIATEHVVIKAMMEELDAAEFERVKERAISLAGSDKVRRQVEEWFDPSKDG